MSFLVLTRKGFEDLAALMPRLPSPLWVNADVLAHTEISALRSSGVEVTNFTRRIEPSNEGMLANAVSIIQEHHPGVTVWVEHVHGAEA